MTKPDFTAALKRAQTLNGGYPITPGERDIFYEAFKDEHDEGVLYALDMVGKSKERISYANIQGYIRMHRNERLRDAQEGKGPCKHSDVPFKEIYEEFPPEVKAVFDRLTDKNKKW